MRKEILISSCRVSYFLLIGCNPWVVLGLIFIFKMWVQVVHKGLFRGHEEREIIPFCEQKNNHDYLVLYALVFKLPFKSNRERKKKVKLMGKSTLHYLMTNLVNDSLFFSFSFHSTYL
ncbi:hypothetical protein VIGAN_02179000, partial [Vigna angularis var. angularis]